MRCQIRSGCGSLDVAPHTIRHEIGHALGFWHTNTVNDLMWGGTWTNPEQQPSPRELYHARIAYSRRPGNTDPDNEAFNVVAPAPLSVP
jgi:predicted Zn-dependent protease